MMIKRLGAEFLAHFGWFLVVAVALSWRVAIRTWALVL